MSRAVTVTLWLNAVEVVASLCVIALGARDYEAAFVNLAYASVSVAQVLFLRWAFLRHAAEYPMGRTNDEVDVYEAELSAYV